jgi:hypothetical protein
MRIRCSILVLALVATAVQQGIAQQYVPTMFASSPAPEGAQAFAPGPAQPPGAAGENCAGGACEADPRVCRWQVFGEFLYLCPRKAEIAFAVPFDGPVEEDRVPIQVGPTAMLDPDYEVGFRVGFAWTLDECSSLGATYTYYRSETAAAIDAGVTGHVIRSMVMHPSTPDGASDWLTAQARGEINFDLVDFDYRHVLLRDDPYCVNYLVGLRYAHLDQSFASVFSHEITERVDSTTSFDGGGIRIGLDAERYAANCGLLLYGKGAASLVAGKFQADYRQGSVQDPAIVETTWGAGRVVTMLDLELGVGWVSCGGRLRLTGGYLFSGWYDVVKPGDFIRGVQRNDYGGLSNVAENPLQFDGLVARAEWRW